MASLDREISLIVHLLEDLSRFGCPVQVIRPIEAAINLQPRNLAVHEFSSLVEWSRGILGWDACEALQVDPTEPSGETLQHLLNICLYAQKLRLYPSLLPDAVNAADTLTDHVAELTNCSDTLFPPGK